MSGTPTTGKALQNSIYDSSQFSADQTAVIDEMYNAKIDTNTIALIAFPWLSALSMSIIMDYVIKGNTIVNGEISKFQRYGDESDSAVQQIYIAKINGLSKEKLDILYNPDIHNRKIIRILLEKNINLTDEVITLLSSPHIDNKYIKMSIIDFINGTIDEELWVNFIKIISCKDSVTSESFNNLVEYCYNNIDKLNSNMLNNINSLRPFVDENILPSAELVELCINTNAKHSQKVINTAKKYISKIVEGRKNQFRALKVFLANSSITIPIMNLLWVYRLTSDNWIMYDGDNINLKFVNILKILNTVSKDVEEVNMVINQISNTSDVDNLYNNLKDMDSDSIKAVIKYCQDFNLIEVSQIIYTLNDSYSIKSIDTMMKEIDATNYVEFYNIVVESSNTEMNSKLKVFFKKVNDINIVEFDEEEYFDEEEFTEVFIESKNFKPIYNAGISVIDLVSCPGTHIITLNKSDDSTYKYVFHINNDDEELEYTANVKTNAQAKDAIQKSILIIEDIPEYSSYVDDLKEILESLNK